MEQRVQGEGDEDVISGVALRDRRGWVAGRPVARVQEASRQDETEGRVYAREVDVAAVPSVPCQDGEREEE